MVDDSNGVDAFSRQLLTAMYSFRDGNFGVRLPHDLTGVQGKIADAFNDIVTLAERRSRETARVSHMVGREGKLKQRMNIPVLVAAVVITVLVLAGSAAGSKGLTWYNLLADTWLVGILPVTLYPFFGGKIWCRYWCPLAKMMEYFSQAFTRMKASRFAIHSNDRCIACGEC